MRQVHIPQPPYFPEAIEVPGNVAVADYDVRLKFVHRVITLHALSLIVAVILAYVVDLKAGWLPPLVGLLIGLILHAIFRRYVDGSKQERLANLIILPLTLLSMGYLGRALQENGVPVWLLPWAIFGVLVYTIGAGRDFSFLGCFFLSLIAATVSGFILVAINPNWFQDLPRAILICALWLFYYVYDLAMLLKRRRVGEELCAVTDLYCDVLNFLTYPLRVYRHWEKFPTEEELAKQAEVQKF